MSQNLLLDAIHRQNQNRPPVWFMRQAGRYHSHYQGLKEKHSFIDLCKVPELACETTMGPIRDFDFDAAILFSDLLFPLEVMGMGLQYSPGPQLDWHLRTVDDIKKLKSQPGLANQLRFQSEAIVKIRKVLSPSKGLIGFVGAPLTLFFYAVEGSHKGDLQSAKSGIADGRFKMFVDQLSPLLIENMVDQANSGLDAIALFDTCAGELDPKTYFQTQIEPLKKVLEEFKKRCPHTPIIYYSKGTGPQHWEHLHSLPIQCLGVDWHHDLDKVLNEFSSHWAIQGNIDPHWLFLPEEELTSRLSKVFEKVAALPRQMRQGWICGLGHGVLPKTPETSVRLFLKLQRQFFSE